MCYDGPSLYYVDYSEFTIQSQAVIFTAALSLSVSLFLSVHTHSISDICKYAAGQLNCCLFTMLLCTYIEQKFLTMRLWISQPHRHITKLIW